MKSTISRRNNISKMLTHKCDEAPDDHTPEEELNFIEQYWGNTKFRYQETPFTSNEEEMIQNMRECLDSVPVEFIDGTHQ